MADDATRLKALLAALRQIRTHANRNTAIFASEDQQRTHNAWLRKFSKETKEDLSHFDISVRYAYKNDDFLSTLDATISYLEALAPSWQSRQSATRSVPKGPPGEQIPANDETIDAEFLEIQAAPDAADRKAKLPVLDHSSAELAEAIAFSTWAHLRLWRQKVDWRHGKALTRKVGKLGVKFGPKVNEPFEINERDFPSLLHPSEIFGVPCETADGHKQPSVIFVHQGYERAHSIGVDALLLPLHLHLNSWRTGAKRIGVCHDIQPSVLARWRNPRCIVAHCLKQVGNELLELIRVHRPDVRFNLRPGLLFSLLKCDA